MDTQSSTLLLESSWHPTNILDPVTETINNRTKPWFGGEGASSLRTPNCRRALGLLFLDWSSECSTTPLVRFRPDRRPCLSRELLALVRAGKLTAPNALTSVLVALTVCYLPCTV